MGRGRTIMTVGIAMLAAVFMAPGQDLLIPRFIGEVSLHCRDLTVSKEGQGTSFEADYRWWDHGINYRLLTGQNSTDGVGHIRCDLPGVDLADFDQLVMGFEPHWEGQTVTLIATVDGTPRQAELTIEKRNDRHWLTVPLGEGDKLDAVEVIIEAETFGEYSGIIKDILLRDSEQYEMQKQHWERFREVNWDHYLKPADYEPSYNVTRGLFYNDEDIEQLRAQLADDPDLKEAFLRNTHGVAAIDREGYVYPVLPYVAREAHMPSEGWYLHHAGRDLAFRGLVARDPVLMREAARMALLLAAYGNWNDMPIPDQTPGQWYESAFWPSFVSEAIALNLDYAGEMLTDDGYKYVLKALYKKGVSQINYSLYARPMYDSNQYVYFNSGRVAANLILEKTWPEIADETDLYVQRIENSVDLLFREAGGFKESTGYLDVVIPHMMRTYYMYAKVRGLPLQEVVPKRVLESVAYAQVLRSSVDREGYTVLPIGDTHRARLKPETAGFMAMLNPGSAWEAIYWRQPVPEDDLANAFIRQALADRPAAQPGWEPLVHLPDVGLAASHRQTGDRLVKLVVMGAHDRGKQVQEPGSFVLEYGGESYALGMPNVRWGVYTNATFYNMLLPRRKDGRLPEIGRQNIPLTAKGDENSFHATLDLTPALQQDAMTKWQRTIDSPSPDRLTITDEYALTDAADGADFLWHTHLPVTVEDRTITIHGERGRCMIEAPAGSVIELEPFTREEGGAVAMGLPADQTFTRIRIHYPETTGIKTVQVVLEPHQPKEPK